MTFYLQYDDSVPADLVNGKRIKKAISSELSRLKLKFNKVCLNIEDFKTFSVKITAQNDFEQFEYECEDECLKKAIDKCIKGFIENCSSPV